jgi:hypothetical protein
MLLQCSAYPQPQSTATWSSAGRDAETVRGLCARRSLWINMLAAAVSSKLAIQAGLFLDAHATGACVCSAPATSTHTATATTSAAAPSENNGPASRLYYIQLSRGSIHRSNCCGASE